MTSPPDRDAQSVAEGLFADLMLRADGEREQELQRLSRARPELAERLAALWREWLLYRSVERAGLPGGAPLSLEPPRIAGYVCRALLGRGGMGEVWEALDPTLERRVALKLLPSGALSSTVGRERFRREALAASRVQHPGIATVYAAGEEAGRGWIAMELVPGGRTLREPIEELRRGAAIPPDHERRMAALFLRVAEALEAAHRSGVVHRDLKPQNILLAADESPKLADFGLARLAGEASLSLSGQFLGTWLYASPEHLAGPEGIDAQSDVFSLGVVLYEALTLQRPFRGESGQEIAHSILHDDPVEPHRLRPRVPRDLSVVCMKALARSRRERTASMQALADDLRRFLDGEPVHARPPSAGDRARRWARRHPVRATALALGGTALLGLGALEWRTLTALETARRAQAGESTANARLAQSVEELRAARDEARADRTVSEDVLQVLSSLFLAGSTDRLGRAEPTVRELVEAGAERLRSGEPASPRARARLLGTLGAVLTTLGERQRAQDFLEEALELWRAMERLDEPAALEARATLAHLCMSRGDVARTLELAEPLVALWRRGGLADELAARVLADAGLAHAQSGALGAARTELEESLRLRVALGGERSSEAAFARALLAQVDYQEGRFAEGLALLEPDVERLRPLALAGNPVGLDACNMRGLFLQALGRPSEAEDLLLEALAAAERTLGPDHPRTLVLRSNLATVLVDLGRADDAEALLRESLELAREHLGPHAKETHHALHDLAQCHVRAGRLEEAEPLLRELVTDVERSLAPDDLYAARARLSLAECLSRQGRAAEAVPLVERSLAAIPPELALHAAASAALESYRRSAGETPGASHP